MWVLGPCLFQTAGARAAAASHAYVDQFAWALMDATVSLQVWQCRVIVLPRLQCAKAPSEDR